MRILAFLRNTLTVFLRLPCLGWWFLFLFGLSNVGWAALNLKQIPCAAWLRVVPALTVEREVLTARQAQGLHYLRQAYHDHLMLGKTFVSAKARAQALAVYWPQEEAFVNDFLPNLRAAIVSSQWPKDHLIDALVQDAENDLLELTGGELLLTLKLYKDLDQQIDCLRQRSLPIVQEARQRINQLLLNLQEEQSDLWPDLEKRSAKWPSWHNGNQFTLALRSFLLNVQQAIIVLAQHIEQDNLMALHSLMDELHAIEKALAAYPQFMTDYLHQHPF